MHVGQDEHEEHGDEGQDDHDKHVLHDHIVKENETIEECSIKLIFKDYNPIHHHNIVCV